MSNTLNIGDKLQIASLFSNNSNAMTNFNNDFIEPPNSFNKVSNNSK